MTNKEIDAIIEEMFAGAPGPPHGEWEPKHDQWAQAAFLDGMLRAWDRISPSGRKSVIKALHGLINDYWAHFGPITDILVLHARRDEVAEAVKKHFVKGIFCEDLLGSMIRAGVDRPDWISGIRGVMNGRGFKETSFDTDLESLSASVSKLLDEAEAPRGKTIQ